MTRRRYLTPRAAMELWHQQADSCAECRTHTAFPRIQWDHVVALCLGGSNDPDNWQGLCAPCHATKTRREAGMRAKADRLAKGPKQPKGRKMQARPFSRWRKRFDGTVVLR